MTNESDEYEDFICNYSQRITNLAYWHFYRFIHPDAQAMTLIKDFEDAIGPILAQAWKELKDEDR